MRFRQICILLIGLLLGMGTAHAWDDVRSIRIEFEQGDTQIDPAYKTNAANLDSIVSTLRFILNDPHVSDLEVRFSGTTSPDGGYRLNRRISLARREAVERYVRERVELPDSIVTHGAEYIDWERLATMVEGSGIEESGRILDILRGEHKIVEWYSGVKADSRVLALRELNWGWTWREMVDSLFPSLRNGVAVYMVCRRTLPQMEMPDRAILDSNPLVASLAGVAPMKPVATVTPVTEKAVTEVAATETVATKPVATEPAATKKTATEKAPATQRLHIKTNALGWVVLGANIGVEADLYRHLSLAVPFYYSALDFFKSDIKFRTIALQPELRGWLSPDNRGLFFGAHFGMAYYNIATDGKYRIQDHAGNSPALGGGISVGYRMSLGRHKHWHIEFSVGAGAYSVHYDRYHNKKNGFLHDTVKRTYWGLDQANVSFSYSFDLGRKGGRK